MHRNDIERCDRAAIRSAQHEVIIANASYFPGFRLLRDLRRAAHRDAAMSYAVSSPMLTVDMQRRS